MVATILFEIYIFNSLNHARWRYYGEHYASVTEVEHATWSLKIQLSLKMSFCFVSLFICRAYVQWRNSNNIWEVLLYFQSDFCGSRVHGMLKLNEYPTYLFFYVKKRFPLGNGAHFTTVISVSTDGVEWGHSRVQTHGTHSDQAFTTASLFRANWSWRGLRRLR